MRSMKPIAASLLALGVAACSTVPVAHQGPPASWDDVLALPAASAGERIAYGSDAKQFGDLRMPRGRGPHPVVVLLHGGCWQAEYDLEYFAHLADRLAQQGIATWSLEYRRIGDAGGGWPGTFDDVAAGTAHLRTLAATHALDLDRVVVAGHSAGGHLALWLAAHRQAPITPSATPSAPLPLKGVVGLAAITDLREYAAGTGSCNQSVVPLLGGSPAQVPERYAAASPAQMLPVGVPVRLVIGSADPIVAPASNETFAAQAHARGDAIGLTVVPGAGHFDLVMPHGAASEQVQKAIRELLRAD